jgi:NADPH-dependent 2,4-dienoyl-CoA reductase/sulfur reductase-like enzyme
MASRLPQIFKSPLQVVWVPGERSIGVYTSSFQIVMVVPVSTNERVLIVGAGCFGLSTAYHLLRRGFADVTVLDRSEKLPAPDAASNDMNRSEQARVYFPFSETFLTISHLACCQKSCERPIPTFFTHS